MSRDRLGGVGDLLERADALGALADALASVRPNGGGRIVFVSGEAGVGKTSLVRSFCADVDSSVRVLVGGCDPLSTPRPLGPLLAIAEEARPHEWVATFATQLDPRQPCLLVLEDAHWADEATLDVLKLLARRVDSLSVLVVATYRDDELDRKHPLRLMLGELATSAAFARVRLGPLSPEAVTELAAPYGVDADELYRKTTGNPFFVVEALAGGTAEIPDTVRDAVLARAARLGDEARALLETVAIVPRPVEFALLDTLSPSVDRLDECVSSGMLLVEGSTVLFRHELARLAIEESIPLDRKIALHRAALTALGEHGDLAQLAHHAEAAGDTDAVLRFARAAAVRAGFVGAHRESVLQYDRVLRFADRLPPAERARVLVAQSHECYVTDQYDKGIEALEDAIACYRSVGDRRSEAEALRILAGFLWCPGRVEECERAATEAARLLEELGRTAELARAYETLAFVCGCGMRHSEAATWATRTLELVDEQKDPVTALRARVTIAGLNVDAAGLEAILAESKALGRADVVGEVYSTLGAIAGEHRWYPAIGRYLDDGLAHCSEWGFELFRLYLHAHRARYLLDIGEWDRAVEDAESVVRVPRTSTTPRIFALVVLATVRARRGDPEVWPLLDEALALAEPTGELPRIGPVAVARAEAAWLDGRPEAVRGETDAALELANLRYGAWFAGELAAWRRRAGIVEEPPPRIAKPFELELAGNASAAAAAWSELGCTYNAALVQAETESLEELNSLGARRTAAAVARTLRERGVRGVPRGPRPTTRRNPGGLTRRELDVLLLVAEGLRNADIAERLFLSEKTVGHHVSAILRKLDVTTRGQAAAAATQLGAFAQDR